jgi:hypothetical protein
MVATPRVRHRNLSNLNVQKTVLNVIPSGSVLAQEGFRGVPDDGAVHPAGVDGEHCLVEVSEVVSLLDCGAEVLNVSAGLADVFRTVGVAVLLVAGTAEAPKK